MRDEVLRFWVKLYGTGPAQIWTTPAQYVIAKQVTYKCMNPIREQTWNQTWDRIVGIVFMPLVEQLSEDIDER